jgi:Zn-dependent protease with chaperone function
MRLPLVGLGLLAGLSVVACSVLGDGDASTQEANHTEGDPTFAQHEWLWADETEEEFKKNAIENASGWMGPADFVPLDDPMTKRLQYWVHKMDAVLREAYPDKLKATPEPKLIIRKSDTPNAWVTGFPVTVARQVRVQGGPVAVDAGPALDGSIEAGVDGGPAPQAVAPSLTLRRSGLVEATTDATSFERTLSADQGIAFAKFFSDNFSRCRVSAEGEAFVFTAECASKNLRLREGQKLAYYATAKYVTITTAYIKQLMDEDRIISTLAHELGHFYRSHTNVPSDAVNYFYSLEAPHAEKPAPDPRYIEQTARARQKIREPSLAAWDDENALMRDNALGFYTTEQEADEIALEVMSKIGVPPGVAIDKVLNMLKNFGGGGIGWAECSMLRDHGWKDADGKTVSVPVGDPSDAHHNLCFRAFNMSREIDAHRYQPVERPMPNGDWSVLFARFITDLAAPAAPPAPPPVDAGAPVDAGSD